MDKYKNSFEHMELQKAEQEQEMNQLITQKQNLEKRNQQLEKRNQEWLDEIEQKEQALEDLESRLKR